MKHCLFSSLARAAFALLFAAASLSAAEPLRVFIRGGQSNRGQEVHAHPRFLGEWTKLLTERGMKVDGGMELPTAEQIAKLELVVNLKTARELGLAIPQSIQVRADRVIE